MYGQYNYEYGQQQTAEPQWYRAQKVPPNYAAQGAAIAGCGMGILYLVCLLPFCQMQRVSLFNSNLSGFILEKLEIQASLWDIHLQPVCPRELYFVQDFATMVCTLTNGLWGHHMIMDMNSHACNFEEVVMKTWGGMLLAGQLGCNHFNLMSIGSLVTIFCLLGALACHFACALNAFTYYWQDTSVRRRRFVVFFGACAPCCAVTGGLAYVMLFNISTIIVPHTLKPPPGVLYPAGWGSVLFMVATIGSCLQTAILLMYLDKLPSETDTLKYEQYTNYSAMLQQEAMLQQQQSAAGAVAPYDAAGGAYQQPYYA